MKLKTTFLASMLAIAGIATLSALPWDSKYNPNPEPFHGKATVVNPCCNVKTELVAGPDGKGYLTRQDVTCKANCKASHKGKNCSPAEARKCAK